MPRLIVSIYSLKEYILKLKIRLKQKTEFHKAYTSPIKQKRADRNSPVESFYQDADGDWKKIVKTPDFEFSHIDGVVSCCIRDESENKVVATIEELEGTK